MKTYAIAYDAHNAGENALAIARSIQDISVEHSRLFSTTWLIQTPLNRQDLRDRLSLWLNHREELFITEVENSASSYGNCIRWEKGQYLRPLSQLFKSTKTFGNVW